ncbi:hypothetical protein DSO57_1017534 [Entomophthora muscae]|uniref:Uncharacterized protein n=1 Tax=Entomophthora muscae TaxID=34485 RepID=A0ACC2U325_9FUNG|nr:hypothetical protein DSO57_1017534 [Entomophthora muscae]
MFKEATRWFVCLFFSLCGLRDQFGLGTTSRETVKDIDLSLSKCNGLDIREVTITQVHAWFKAKRLTPLDLTRCYLARINKMDPFLHSIIEVNPDAEKIARNLEFADFTRYPLWGIPVLVKDNIATTDSMNTTAGSFLLLNSKPKHEAAVIRSLRRAGAIILGKTNMSDLTG